MGEILNACNLLVGKYKGKDNLTNLGIDGRIKIKRILRNCGGRLWTGCIWLRIETSGGL
jgi:hypothetical protein